MKKIALLIFSTYAVPIFCIAQEENKLEGKYDTLEIDDFYLDLNAPEITAFSLLDVKKEDIETAGSIKELLINVEDVITNTGEVKPGLAVEWAPTKSLADKKANKWNEGWAFAARNWAVSLATTTTDSVDLRLGAGIKFNIIDRTNILNNKDFQKDVDKLKMNAINDFNEVNNKAKERGDKALLIFGNECKNIFGSNYLESLDEFSSSTNMGNANEFEKVRHYFDSMNIPEDGELIRNYLERTKTIITDKIPKEQFDSLEVAFNKALDNYLDEMIQVFFFRVSHPNLKYLFTNRLMELKESYRNKLWNKPSIQMSGGLGWSSDSAQVTDFQKFNRGISLSAAFPCNPLFWMSSVKQKNNKIYKFFDSNTRLALTARYQTFVGEEVYDAAMIGGRFLLGNSNTRFSIEHARYFYWNESKEISDMIGSRVAVGVEVKVMDTWLEMVVGGATSGGIDELKAYPSLGFRRSLNKEKRKLY